MVVPNRDAWIPRAEQDRDVHFATLVAIDG
jgi:hypothetical protein